MRRRSTTTACRRSRVTSKSLITSLNDDGKLTFTKTEEVNTENTPRFKVTLGVVPDYLYDGKGMRIDGVTDGKPAANAGLAWVMCGDRIGH
jgi:hypothetical protein